MESDYSQPFTIEKIAIVLESSIRNLLKHIEVPAQQWLSTIFTNILKVFEQSKVITITILNFAKPNDNSSSHSPITEPYL